MKGEYFITLEVDSFLNLIDLIKRDHCSPALTLQTTFSILKYKFSYLLYGSKVKYWFILS